jgi:cbb3-type cytochrome oxidase maturation protein
MDEATIAQTFLTLAILAIFVGFLIWAIKSGQFNNVEGPKYRMLSDKTEKSGGKAKVKTEEDKKP